MLQVDFIKDNFSKVIDSLKKRNKDYSSDLKKIIDFNESRKKQQTKLDTLLFEVNNLSKQIGELFKNGKVDEANELKKEVEKIKPEIKLLQELLNSNNKDLQELITTYNAIMAGQLNIDEDFRLVKYFYWAYFGLFRYSFTIMCLDAKRLF